MLAAQDKLPSFEDLEIAAKKLCRSYSSLRGQQRALKGEHALGSASAIPIGEKYPDAKPEFKGDQTLAKSIAFIRDAMLAREFSLATAAGDVRRIWEVIKVTLFSFAGSSHSKYMQYYLEIITSLELESSAELRHGLLQMTLINITGHEGHWSAADFVQEYFNRLLEAVVQRKGADYGDKNVRDTWSRIIHHIARLKLSFLDSIGLKERSRRHTGANHSAESKILLAHYKDVNLHTFCSGRTYDSELYVCDYQKGTANLENGKLQKWVDKTERSRNVTAVRAPGPEATSIQEHICVAEDRTTFDFDLLDEVESDDEDLPEASQIPTSGRPKLRVSALVESEFIVQSIEDAEKSINEVLEVDSDSESEVEDI